MAITSIVALTFKPDSVAQAEGAVRSALELARGFEGNLGVDVLVDQTDDTRWLLVERWVSEQADEAYRAHRAEKGITSALGPLLAAAPEVVRYDVAPAGSPTVEGMTIGVVRDDIRARIGRYGLWRLGGDTCPSFGIAADRHGFGSVWYGGVRADLDIPSQVLAATDRIVVGSGIVNIFATDPREVAASYHRLHSAHPERFILGIGLGHPERTELARRPLGALVAYLDALLAEGVPAGRVVLAAMGPRVQTLAAERTGGAHPYLVTPAHTRAAREVLGESPLLIPEQRVVLDASRGRALETARPGVEFYLNLRNYRRNLQRLGFTAEELDSASPRVIDALVVSGTADAAKAGLDAHLLAGADHVLAQVVTPDGRDAIADVAALGAILGLTPSRC